MKILLSLTLIFVFAAAGFGQVESKLPTEKPPSSIEPAKINGKTESENFYKCGMKLSMQNEYDLAIIEFTKAIESDSEFAEAYIRRGAVYYFKNDNKRAVSDFNRAIELNPKLMIAYAYRAFSFLNEKDYPSAVNDYTKAIELTSKKDQSALWYDKRADAYDAMNQKESASADRRKAEELRKN